MEIKIPSAWTPKTDLGRKVHSGEIRDLDLILDNGLSILEPEIVDSLLPEMQSELLLIGQAKGKFGGGQRRVFRQTQKKTREGNKPKFTTLAVIGNKDGYVGIGLGKSKETVPAREKALKTAKLNLFKISRGNGSWESNSKEPSSIPFAVEGKCGSVHIKLMPAPKGKGLCVEKECAKILALAGIKDVWSKTQGQTKNKINLVKACEQALRKLSTTKTRAKDVDSLSIQEGRIKVA
ncbi:30S ribosomal protein S5 [Candidatus Woesearchaeota archaeon CG10_big_fil_rev_8_21_14_0_10_32_9]|nr:MAG: 30S ribosomal protein S5 [Candidatus Woesearchaeota archaeon CG10_big_fil_rev_8_21_14_0_10_32_9]